MRNPRHIAIVLFAGLSLGGEPASAARLINVRFEGDGRLLLETYYQDGGLPDAATVWRYLGRKPIMVAESSSVVANSADTIRADLGGDVTISILHADRMIAQAKVRDLALVRDDPSNSLWFLPGDEVERTARAAGVGPPVSSWGVWTGWIALAACAVVCSGLWWIASRRRHKRDDLVN